MHKKHDGGWKDPNEGQPEIGACIMADGTLGYEKELLRPRGPKCLTPKEAFLNYLETHGGHSPGMAKSIYYKERMPRELIKQLDMDDYKQEAFTSIKSMKQWLQNQCWCRGGKWYSRTDGLDFHNSCTNEQIEYCELARDLKNVFIELIKREES